MTQAEFAKSIGLSTNFVWMLEKGERVPSDRTISDICRCFSVSEQWLRTGEGPMFQQKSLSDELFDTFKDFMKDAPDLRRRLILGLSKLNKEEWKLIDQIARKLLEEESSAESKKPPLAMAARGGKVAPPQEPIDEEEFESMLADVEQTESL